MQSLARRRHINRAAKIGIGSALAIVIAEFFGLEYATSAGSVTLLTILSTKWETVKLAYSRVLSFLITMFLAFIYYTCFGTNWFTFSVFLLTLAIILFLIGWDSSLSVNALIGIQIITEGSFSWAFMLNEFYIVLIGIGIAILFNLISDNKGQRRVIIQDQRKAEEEMRGSLTDIALYLENPDQVKTCAWDRLIALEKHLEEALERAWTYQNDTFVSHPQYYIDYLEMRSKQAGLLHNMHYQIKILKHYPEEAEVAARELRKTAEVISEYEDPVDRLESLNAFASTVALYPARENSFEGQAVVYHILITLTEVLVLKHRFVLGLDERERRIYVEKKPGRKLSDIHF